ncbi:uncharacterized protein [Osmerus mordax]|uniref:uncharacterized protein n=1 Tax=Osmerus mordax TaxID=8014 RepID=UPI00350EC0D8
MAVFWFWLKTVAGLEPALRSAAVNRSPLSLVYSRRSTPVGMRQMASWSRHHVEVHLLLHRPLALRWDPPPCCSVEQPFGSVSHGSMSDDPPLSQLCESPREPDGDHLHYKVGENISLPCNNVIYPDCSSTTWIFKSTELVGHGKIKDNSGRAERLSLGSDCSLIVLNVKTEDSGRYTCRQYLRKEGYQDGNDAVVELSVQTSLTTPLSTTSTPPFTVGGAVGAAVAGAGGGAVGAAVGGVIGAVLLCLLAVIIIVHKKRAKNQKPNNDSLALTTDIVSNTTGNQQTLPTNEDKDGCDDGPTYVTINHPSQNKAAPKPDTQQEDMVTYASVNLSSSRRN